MTTTSRIEAVDAAAEADLIRRAQEGDENAKAELFERYTPVIKAVAHRYRSATFDYDDAFQEASIAFLEIIENHDPERSPVLAGYVRRYLEFHLKAVATDTTNVFGIPAPTFRRYLRIMREAEGDLITAARICQKHKMTIATLLDIYKVVGTVSLDGETDEEDVESDRLAHSRVTVLGRQEEQDAYDAMTDSWDVRALLDELDDESREIIRIAYGFEPAVIDGEVIEELPSDRSLAAYDDATVAAAMTWRHQSEGKTYSRQKVQRRRTAALQFMREKYEMRETR